MAINETAQQFIESLTTSFLTDVIKQVHEDAIASIKNKASSSDINEILENQIRQEVLKYFDQNLKDSIESELKKNLLELNVESLISQEISEKLIPELKKQNWVNEELSSQISQIDYNAVIQNQTDQAIKNTQPAINELIIGRLNKKLEEKLVDIDITTLLSKQVTEQLIPKLEQQNRDRIAAEISNGLAHVNLHDIVRQQSEIAIKNLITAFNFPSKSIPGDAIDSRNLVISAENIIGGIFKNLQSTGIQDSASQCQVTILDTATVFENKLVAGGLEVVGEMTIHKDAVFKGNVIFEGIVKEDVVSTIQNRMVDIDVSSLLQDQISQIVLSQFSDSIKENINQKIKENLDSLDIVGLIGQQVVSNLIPEFEKQNKDRVAEDISTALKQLDLIEIVRQQADAVVGSIVTSFKFPDWSIPSKAVDPRNLVISADNINGGVFKSFESTGIQDRTSQCQVTIGDEFTVFENKLVSSGLHVVGPVTIDQDTVFKGNITVEGTLPEDSAFVNQIVSIVVDHFNKKFDTGTFDQYTNRVFMRIADEGIDASIVLVGQNPLVEFDGSLGSLAPTIVNSNLQSVGALKELQVIGETLLDQTLYVSNKRIGINTIEPERALDLWDQEVQIIAGKRQQDTAIFGTIRNQNLIISANGKDQLIVNSDGSVSVKTLKIGRTNHTSSPRMPTDNRPIAHITWNENPTIGAPIGWVSLGGARWAAFGLIAG